MRLFIYEHLCATQLDTGSSLAREGRAMLSAIVADMSAVGGCEVVTMLHESATFGFGGSCYRTSTANVERLFRRLARDSDYTLVIAPEFDDILATRSEWVLEAGGKLLGSPPDVVCLAADKESLAKHFESKGIPAPEVMCRFSPASRLPEQLSERQFVLKPRHGAGMTATYFVEGTHQLPRFIEQAFQECPNDDLLLQPFVAGLPVSVSFLMGSRTIVPLLSGEQIIERNGGKGRYVGGALPLPPALASRAIALAEKAVESIPALRGYVGVDLVLSDLGDTVIEINPRLTTSYIGLRKLTDANLAGVWLNMVGGGQREVVKWRDERVRFSCSHS